MADVEEFDAFVTARSPALLRTAYLLTGDWGLAEDLLQTALARSWLAWRRITSSPEGYVRRTMVTTYTTWWRRKWRQERPSSDVPDRPGRDEIGALDVRDEVWRLLSTLAPRQRAVLVLRYYEDMTEAQAADVLGCSVGTVKSQTSRALATLRGVAQPVTGVCDE